MYKDIDLLALVDTCTLEVWAGCIETTAMVTTAVERAGSTKTTSELVGTSASGFWWPAVWKAVLYVAAEANWKDQHYVRSLHCHTSVLIALFTVCESRRTAVEGATPYPLESSGWRMDEMSGDCCYECFEFCSMLWHFCFGDTKSISKTFLPHICSDGASAGRKPSRNRKVSK